MALLSVLDMAERDALWRTMLQAIRDTQDEMAQLERLSQPVREMLYGPGVYESYRDMRNELVDLLADDTGAPGTTLTPLT